MKTLLTASIAVALLVPPLMVTSQVYDIEEGLSAVLALGASTGTAHAQAMFRGDAAHTGALFYEPGAPEIPAAAISIPDGDMLHRHLSKDGASARAALALGCAPLAAQRLLTQLQALFTAIRGCNQLLLIAR